jgi:hypothetical protein
MILFEQRIMFGPKHTEKLGDFANKFGVPNQGDDHARVWTRQLAEQFAFSFQGEGWGTKRAGEGRAQSTDVICRREDGILIGYDTVINAGAPNASINWHPSPMNIDDQVFIAVSPTDHIGEGSQAKHQCRLGISFFPALGLYVRDRQRFREEVDWFKDALKPDYARIFWYLDEGPWDYIGTGWMGDGQRQATLTMVIEELLSIGCKPQVTVFGSVVRDLYRRRQLIEQFADAFRPYGSRCFLVDGVNEPGAIGYEPGHYADTREIARNLAAANLGVQYISAASPDFLHGGFEGTPTDEDIEADTCKLYDALPPEINAITPHWGRNPWIPNRPLGRCATGKILINDEPRGFRSSVSAIEDPRDFARDYQGSAMAGDLGYTLHTEPGIWEGYCDSSSNPAWEENNKYERIQDIPRIYEIIAALHAVRQGVEIPTPQPGEHEDKLLSGQRLLPEESLISPAGDAHLHYQAGDGNLVVYLKGQPVWESGTSGSTAKSLEMQGDGNLVLYSQEEAIRSTRTTGHDGAMVQIQDDGNFVVYEDPNGPKAGEAIWASATDPFYPEPSKFQD